MAEEINPAPLERALQIWPQARSNLKLPQSAGPQWAHLKIRTTLFTGRGFETGSLGDIQGLRSGRTSVLAGPSRARKAAFILRETEVQLPSPWLMGGRAGNSKPKPEGWQVEELGMASTPILVHNSAFFCLILPSLLLPSHQFL